MKDKFDAIVLGGGPNSLTAAAYLAKSGLNVGLFETRNQLGSEASTEELIPGHHFNTVYPDGGLFEEEIIEDLVLHDYGLTAINAPVAAFAPNLTNPGLTLFTDPNRSQKEIKSVSKIDADAFSNWQKKVSKFADQLKAMSRLAPPSLKYKSPSHLFAWAKVAISIRRMGGKDMMEFLRVLPMGAARLLIENFESDVLKGLLCVPALSGLMQGTRAAGTAFMLMYQQMGMSNGGFRSSQVFEGGVGSLTNALEKACVKAGVQIQTESEIKRIVVENNQAIGIEFQNGDIARSKVILSGFEARHTFFELLNPTDIEPRFMRRLKSLKLKGTTASIHMSLNDLPNFPSAKNKDSLSGSIVICPSLDYAEKAYDEAKYGRISENPILELRIPSLLDENLAPKGKHNISITYRYAPFHLNQSDWDTSKDELLQNAINNIEIYAPGFAKLIEKSIVISPLDYEREYGLTEGSLTQGQMSLDQLLLMRPVPGFAGYRSPISALYLCGPAMHPGGGLSGMPGRNAAKQVISEFNQ